MQVIGPARWMKASPARILVARAIVVSPIVLAAALGVVLARPPHLLVRAVARRLPEVLFFVPTSRRMVALTIDDGSHPSTTPAVLDVLARHSAKATFFLLGRLAEQHPELVRRIAADGHELGNHGWLEEASVRLPAAQLADGLDRTHRALARFGPVSLFRPGSGWVSSSVLEACRGRGYRCVVGSVYPQDAHLHWWRYHAFDVLRRIRPGAIVVLHEGRPERAAVAQALDRILPVLRLRGYDVMTVSNLVGAGDRPATGSYARCF